jgi:hypothetical protein
MKISVYRFRTHRLGLTVIRWPCSYAGSDF